MRQIELPRILFHVASIQNTDEQRLFSVPWSVLCGGGTVQTCTYSRGVTCQFDSRVHWIQITLRGSDTWRHLDEILDKLLSTQLYRWRLQYRFTFEIRCLFSIYAMSGFPAVFSKFVNRPPSSHPKLCRDLYSIWKLLWFVTYLCIINNFVQIFHCTEPLFWVPDNVIIYCFHKTFAKRTNLQIYSSSCSYTGEDQNVVVFIYYSFSNNPSLSADVSRAIRFRYEIKFAPQTFSSSLLSIKSSDILLFVCLADTITSICLFHSAQFSCLIEKS